MIKILIISVLAVSVMGQFPRRCRQLCRSRFQSFEICASENRGVSCHRISSCQFDAENCRRRFRFFNRSLLELEEFDRCRDIRTPNTSGSCAPAIRRTRSVRPECGRLKCTDASSKNNCYRSKRNNCRLGTNCQMQRINCERGHRNRVEWTDPRQCAGMKAGQRHQKCKPLIKRG